MNFVGLNSIRSLLVPVPPIEEQQKIAEILSAIDDKINTTNSLIIETKRYKQGLMQQLFTKGIGHTEFKSSELGEIPGVWEVKMVCEFAKIITGKKDTQNKIDDGSYPFVVRSQKLEKINSYSFDGEAVLTAGDGVGVGKVFHYLKEKFDFHQRVYNINSFDKTILGRFFFEYFKLNFIKQVRKYNAKGSVDSVRMDMISKMIIPIPPIVEQNKIATVLLEIDNKIAMLESKRIMYRDLKTSLMQQLLTGKIRVNTCQQKSAVA